MYRIFFNTTSTWGSVTSPIQRIEMVITVTEYDLKAL